MYRVKCLDGILLDLSYFVLTTVPRGVVRSLQKSPPDVLPSPPVAWTYSKDCTLRESLSSSPSSPLPPLIYPHQSLRPSLAFFSSAASPSSPSSPSSTASQSEEAWPVECYRVNSDMVRKELDIRKESMNEAVSTFSSAESFWNTSFSSSFTCFHASPRILDISVMDASGFSDFRASLFEAQNS